MINRHRAPASRLQRFLAGLPNTRAAAFRQSATEVGVEGWTAGGPMDAANFNRRQTIRVGASVIYAQVGVIGFDRPIDLQSLRLYGLPEAAPAVLNGTPLLPQ